MKKYVILLIACAVLFNVRIAPGYASLASTGTVINKVKVKGQAETKKSKVKKIPARKKAAVQKADKKIVVYYFYGNYRCANCYKIEQYSKEAVETYFPSELINDVIEYKMINYDDSANSHYIKDYALFTKSLVVTLRDGEKELKNKNLTGVWNHLNNKDHFMKYVRNEIEQYLSEAKQ